METKNLEKEFQDIHQKLDFISEQMRDYQQRQKELNELKSDLSIIAKDVFDAAVDELQDVAPYFESRDFMLLLKKLLRNTKNISN